MAGFANAVKHSTTVYFAQSGVVIAKVGAIIAAAECRRRSRGSSGGRTRCSRRRCSRSGCDDRVHAYVANVTIVAYSTAAVILHDHELREMGREASDCLRPG
jgi:hypothetical protein